MNLDDILLGHARKEASITHLDASMFVVGLKKLAEGMDAPAMDLPMAEGPFLAPLPDVIALMSQIVAGEFKSQVYYTYYANMLRGLTHGSIADMFTEHAGHELEHAGFILRRISVLSPGGTSIPPYPPPPPMTDPQEIIQSLIAVEQEGISLWKQLHAVCGEDSTKYTVEQYLQQEQEHLDELWQLVEPMALPAQPMGAAGTAPLDAAAPAPSSMGAVMSDATEGPKTAQEIFAAAAVRKQAAEISPPTGVSPMARLTLQKSLHGAAIGNPAGSMIGPPPPFLKSVAAAAEKRSSHALTRQDLLHTGFDPAFEGKKHLKLHEKTAADKKAPGPKEMQKSVAELRHELINHPDRYDNAHRTLSTLGILGSLIPIAGLPIMAASIAHRTYHDNTVHQGKGKDKTSAKKQKSLEDLEWERQSHPDTFKNKHPAWDAALKTTGIMAAVIGLPLALGRQAADNIHAKDQREEIKPINPSTLAGMKSTFDTKTAPPVIKKSALLTLIEKQADDLMVPAPGADSPEAYVAREQQLATQQAMAEASHAKTVAMQSGQAAQQAQAESQAAQQQLQQAQQQLQQSQAESQQSGQQALQAQQQAAEAEARAAEHSVAKMQLGMRMNQIRQELANLVMQDPVSEHAATVSDLAAQGQPSTPQQQQQADAAAQQAQAAQDPNAPKPSANTQEQEQQAQTAQQEAQMQG